jgi:hypothetical protein
LLTLIAALILTAAVAGGLVLATGHLRRRAPAPAAGLAHGGTAVTGLALLTLAALRTPQPLAVNAALFLFYIALIGGAFLWLFRRQATALPGFMIALHGLTALVAVAVLWLGLLFA